jgi:predicted GNAT family N-acyltransferase
MLNARVSARRFFEKFGYSPTSGVFTEVSIPHVKMEKNLLPLSKIPWAKKL